MHILVGLEGGSSERVWPEVSALKTTAGDGSKKEDGYGKLRRRGSTPAAWRLTRASFARRARACGVKESRADGLSRPTLLLKDSKPEDESRSLCGPLPSVLKQARLVFPKEVFPNSTTFPNLKPGSKGDP